MGYKVGISSGWWHIGKDPNLLGLAQKSGAFGATAGVQFNQVDLDTVIEFLEPELKKQMSEVLRTLGIKVGLHGELGEVAALESAERRIYEQVHKRTVATFKFSKEFGFVYVNVHGSQKLQLQQEESRLRPYGYSFQVVDFWGRPFWQLAEENNEGGRKVKEFLIGKISGNAIRQDDAWGKNVSEEAKKIDTEIEQDIQRQLDEVKKKEGYDKLSEAEKKSIERQIRIEAAKTRDFLLKERTERNADFIYNVWKESTYARYVLEAGEIDAYMAVAIYMYYNKDPLWFNIVGDVHPEKAYVGKSPKNGGEEEDPTMEERFNSAVSAKYHEGHLLKTNKELDGLSLKEFCEKNQVHYLIETPHSQAGSEGLARFYRPCYLYELAKRINSPYVKITIDFEQCMGQNIALDDDKKPGDGVGTWPDDIGKYIHLLHLGEPKPYWGTAHIPIALGSIGHEALYRWIFKLRKKGFRDGIIVFERGSGRSGGGKTMFEVFEYSVQAIRNIVQFLEQDIEPKKLPAEFYGITHENKDVFARQQVTIREHAWDPLEGLLSVVEEKHSFLSGAAVAKQKAQEWEKRKFR